jgi:polyisoprenoid-binding protein YceI
MTGVWKAAPGALAVLYAMALAAPAVRAQELALELDPAQTKIEFTLGATMHTVHGSFRLKSGSIHVDPATGKASGSIVVDAASGSSGSEGRDKDMHDKVLESAKFPEISFTPDRFEGQIAPQGGYQVRMHGVFRLHGVDHELTLPIAAHATAEGIAATVQFDVPYVKWGLKNPSTFLLRVSQQVTIAIQTVVKTAKDSAHGSP